MTVNFNRAKEWEKNEYNRNQNLNKKIKGAEVLKDINLHLEGGKVYGLKGKNGSGKTMLMRAVCGLILPTGGSITLTGSSLESRFHSREVSGF